MNIRKFATLAVLVLSSFAASNVAPSKAELEAMYDKAFREFDANDFPQSLKELDAIDARQPDLAESQNLRGVILMRQGEYDKAEAALQKALAVDPKFWNARFNLAEIPFLRKNWAEARTRFQGLLTGNASELQGDAAQLIQYKILLTHLLEGKENMVDSILAKFELSPDTPAAQYAAAAVAFQHKNEKEAKDILAAAEKKFSPQLNKLFAESLYEVGWLQKVAGQTRAALELTSAADKAANAKEYSKAKFEQAQQAFQQRDFTAARKLVDEADAAIPSQAATVNLRGAILLEQKDYDGAEAAFKEALKLDPKFREAEYNSALIPFKKKEYGKARDRFESLFSVTSGGDKDQAAQLIKYKIFLTFLLEGKDSRAQKMMEQFQFTGDTPALYYAQAAWEFKHDNPAKANDWVTSARKIYSPALNLVFADPFYDVGWIRNPGVGAPGESALADAAQSPPPAEATPAIEPSPIPGAAVVARNESKQSREAAAAQPPPSAPAAAGIEGTTTNASNVPASAAQTSRANQGSSAPATSLITKVETPVASTASPAVAQPISANPPQQSAKDLAVASAATSTSANASTVLAPATVRESSKPTVGDRIERSGMGRTLLVVGLLLAGVLLLGWVMLPEIRRRFSEGPVYSRTSSVAGPVLAEATGFTAKQQATSSRMAGGPPQVSLRLKASEPSLRRAAVPLGKPRNGISAMPAETEESQPEFQPASQSDSLSDDRFDTAEAVGFAPLAEGVGEPVLHDEHFSEPVHASAETFAAGTPEIFATAIGLEPIEAPSETGALASFMPERGWEDFSETGSTAAVDPVPDPFEPAPEPEEFESEIETPSLQKAEGDEVSATVLEEEDSVDFEFPASDAAQVDEVAAASGSGVLAGEDSAVPGEFEEEPIGQGQPIPYLTPVSAGETFEEEIVEPEAPAASSEVPEFGAAAVFAGLGALGALRELSEPSSSYTAPVTTTEPIAQPITPAIMSQPTPPSPAPVIRTGPPSPSGMPQPAMPPTQGTMHTSVQLTFSFEIASLQLTPTFKMGALVLKPTSKIVTMRLSPAQHPQPAMNLQVTFEIATVQAAGSSIGMVRLTPSLQQKPALISSPAFNIAGLQLVSGSENAPVQLTASQQGQASVLVTAAFQIATVEFSPAFEIASIVLNSTSKNVSVQLPGTGPSAVEGAPIFEITNVQLSGNGEIGTLQLNPQAGGPKRA